MAAPISGPRDLEIIKYVPPKTFTHNAVIKNANKHVKTHEYTQKCTLLEQKVYSSNVYFILTAASFCLHNQNPEFCV